VKVKCFGCDALIEAATSAAAADAFVVHARERHTWSTPEEALRNYARNVAEAPERLTGGTERLAEIGDITVYPVTEDRVDDWLRFFDHDAFAGNPDWAACYCLDRMYRRRRSSLSARGASHERSWPGAFAAARRSDTSPTSTADRPGG
jgi:hypothetical protein